MGVVYKAEDTKLERAVCRPASSKTKKPARPAFGVYHARQRPRSMMKCESRNHRLVGGPHRKGVKCSAKNSPR